MCVGGCCNLAEISASRGLYDREELVLDRLFLMVTLPAATFFMVTLNIHALHYLCNLTITRVLPMMVGDGLPVHLCTYMYMQM